MCYSIVLVQRFPKHESQSSAVFHLLRVCLLSCPQVCVYAAVPGTVGGGTWRLNENSVTDRHSCCLSHNT